MCAHLHVACIQGNIKKDPTVLLALLSRDPEREFERPKTKRWLPREAIVPHRTFNGSSLFIIVQFSFPFEQQKSYLEKIIMKVLTIIFLKVSL